MDDNINNANLIKKILDNELKPESLGDNFEEKNINAIKLFQKLFVENLHFDLIEGQFGEVGEQILTNEWNKAAEAENAYLIAEKDEFRIIYVVIKKLTRFRERSAISSLKRERWAIKGEYICIFYGKDSAIWHMVCPHYTEGRTILRRYVLGEGENHRTISENLTLMDTKLLEPLFERVQEAFKVQVITNDFYKRYKEVFEKIKVHILNQKIDISKAKKITHLFLNRLMFIYFIQKKGWIDNDKNFMLNYLRKYKTSGDNNIFYNKWLYKLFFEAMSKPIPEKSISDFDNEVNNILNNIPFLNGGLFEEYDVDKLNFSLSDELIFIIIEGFLEEYNFTITEESPFDLDIAIDPAMLGKVYESLIAEEEKGKVGIFYTPRIEVDLMCRLGIYEHLLQDKFEVLSEKNSIMKNKIIKFIFKPLEDWKSTESKDFEFVRNAINNIKIVDPACGSGAFLVGMLQVLIELYIKLGVPPNYDLKEGIIYNSLYGVDIKDWAIRMAEFRLWLSLIENEEYLPNKRPILPNFSFKLQHGDSIVQKIGSQYLNLKILRKNLSKKVKEKIDYLEILKQDYFEGKKNILEKIQKVQTEVFIEIINEKINILRHEKKQKTQKTLDNKITQISMSIIKNINENIIQLEDLLDKIEKVKEKEFIFIWDLNFLEVMLNGGFDIVIANPPYVHKNSIIDPSIDPEVLSNYKDKMIATLRKEYKTDLNNYVKKIFNFSIKKTCDFYVYFFFKGLELLNDKGTLVFISSNSWLNVNFGGDLQEGVLRFGQLRYIIENQIQRTFSEAEINTIISVIRKNKQEKILIGSSKFIAFKKKFEDINYLQYNNILNNVKYDYEFNFLDDRIKINDNNIFKEIKIFNKTLGKFGGVVHQSITLKSKSIFLLGKYEFSKWSLFLLAPKVFFRIVNQKDKICAINKYCDIFLGMTTGYNEFFYLTEEKIRSHNIEEEYLASLIKTPKELKKPFIESKFLKRKVFFVDKDKKELKNTKALEYINYGENLKPPIYLRPFFESKNESNWYKIGVKKALILLPNMIDKSHKISINEKNYLVDKQLICCNPIEEKYRKTIFLILFSSLMIFFKEIIGNTSLGGGALKVSTTDYKNLYFIDLENLNNEIINHLNDIYDNFTNYEYTTTFDELGSKTIEIFNINNILKQRRLVDKIILEDIFNLTLVEQNELYKSIINLINNRIKRSKSV